MSDIEQRLAQATQLMDQVQLLYEEYQAEKRARDAPFQQRQSELERELETLKQSREAASQEVEQKYKPRFDELTWFLPQSQPTKAAKFPPSATVGRGMRRGRNVSHHLSSDDGLDNEDGSENNGDGSEDNEDGSENNGDGSEDNDDESEDNGDGSEDNDDESEDNGDEPEDNDDESEDYDDVPDHGGDNHDNRSAHNHHGPTNAALVSPRASRKRRPTAKAANTLGRPKKRHRSDAKTAGSGSVGVGGAGVAASDGDRRMVSFEDVRGEHRIVPWPAGSHNFYIFRCDSHKIAFNSPNPIQGAAKHIRGNGHSMAGAHENAIRELGFLVQNCTPELAQENNRKFDQPPQNPGSDPKTSIQPICGEFYQVYWHRTPYVALCLPTGSFDTVGISGSLSDTGLARSIPKCYNTHTRTNKILRLNEDYQDGGKMASRRKFPFLFFTNDIQVPSNGAFSIPKDKKVLSWVLAKDIGPQPLDLTDSTIPGHATALAFKRLRDQNGPAVAINNRSSAETDSGPLSNAGGDNGFGGQSQDDPQEVPTASLRARGSETSRHSPHAEQLAAGTLRPEPEPARSDKADNAASSALAALDIIAPGPGSQLPDEDADGAQEAPPSMTTTSLPIISEDSRPSSEDNKQERAEVVVDTLRSEPDRQGYDSTADRGRLDFILEKGGMAG